MDIVNGQGSVWELGAAEARSTGSACDVNSLLASSSQAAIEVLNMRNAYICDAVRTPFGRYGGALAPLRTDDLAVIPIKALVERNPKVNWGALDDVIYGCANQAGEDNRNVARMALLLAGLPVEVPGVTVNRLCGSSLEAISVAARAIKSGEASLVIAGGVESMSRAPFVVAKAEAAFSRGAKIEDTTIGWRFVNPSMKAKYGTDSMPETAENVAEEWKISREDQDAFALRSQQRTAAAMKTGQLAEEIVPVTIPGKKGPTIVSQDEHPRPDTTLEALAKLKPIVKPNGTVTAGNASGVNDGAGALLLASEEAVAKYGLTPLVRVLTSAATGVPPRVMGIGPVSAVRRVLEKTGLKLLQMDVIELNEAFAAQSLAVLRDLGLPDDAAQVNSNGGAIALGHPLGASGARLAIAAVNQLKRTGARYGLCTMCIGVGQGIAVVLEKV
jgi:acetyl-CoA acyltransferase